MNPGAKALIFDCDGTLVDSMPLHYRAWCAALSAAGIEFTERRFYELAGVPSRRVIEIVAAEQGRQVDIAEVVACRESKFLELLPEVTPIAPVVRIAESFLGRGKMAVASGGIRPVVHDQLRAIGVWEWFPVIVTAEDTEKHKPDPDVFLEAARQLGVDPSDCCVYEDADLGLEAAARAGMRAVDIRELLSA